MTSASPFILKKYPFIRLLLSLIAGIILQWYLQLSLHFIFTAAIIISVSLIVFLFLPLQEKFFFRWLQGIFIMLLFVMLGAVLGYRKNIKNQPGWAGNYYKAGAPLIITLEEPLTEKNNSYKALASVNAVEQNNQWQNTKGKILVYFKKDSSVSDLSYGSQIIINAPLQIIANNGNPGAFDYNRYCLFQDITYQVFLKKDQYVVLPQKNINWLQQKLFDIRNATIQTLQKYISGEKEQGVAEALLIGYRNDLDKDLVQAYSNTGVVHIIAISGLHLGMIYGLLLGIFSFFKRYKWTYWLKPIVIFYFHQFPNLFLLTNFIAVPLSGLILYAEILLLCISFISSAAHFIGTILSMLIKTMNLFIEHMNSLPFAVWNKIQVNIVQTWLLYGFIIMVCIWLLHKSSKAFLMSLAFLTGFIVSVSIDIIQRNQQQKIIVYNVPKLSGIDIVQGSQYRFIGDSILLQDDFLRNFHLKPARVMHRTYAETDDNSLFIKNKITKIDNTTLLLLDSSFHYPLTQNKIPVDIIIISKNPKVYMNQLQNSFSFRQLVFDSSNPLWKIERWKKDCDSLHLRFHSVPQQGAFVMDL